MALRRIFYCGVRLDLDYNVTTATVKLSSLGLSAANPSERHVQLPAPFPTGQEIFISCDSVLPSEQRENGLDSDNH